MTSRYGTAIALGAIVLLALAVRVVWTVWTAPVPPFLSDPEYYNAAALSIARGDGYSIAFGDRGFQPGGDPTAFWPPGYSAFLAVFYWLFGEDLAVARAANVVAGTLTVIPFFFIGRRLVSVPAGLLSAGIAAVMPSLVYWTPTLFSDTLFTLLFACSLALLLHARRADGTLRPGMLVALGVAIAASTFVRGQALVLVPLAGAWLVIEGASWKQTALAAAGTAAIAGALLLPWSVRNAAVMDSPILFSANMGYNLRIGHAPYSTGHYILPSDLWDAEPDRSFAQREGLFSELGARRAITYAAEHPLNELELAVSKVGWLWRPDSDALRWVASYGETPLSGALWERLRVLLDASYLSVLSLALAGMFLVRKATRYFTVFAIALWTATHVIFFGEPRYHMPMLAVILPVASASLVWLANTSTHYAASGLPRRRRRTVDAGF
jgi:4-amino-4-deoxy-L-arabinose transferase-like glycosyltransferase